MLTARVVIIGGGLSGLYAASLLEERGIKDYVVLEARDTLGGRILSVPDQSFEYPGDIAHDAVPGRYDLGATWFWPVLQPDLQRLTQQLGLTTFAQHEDGDMLIERDRVQAPRRVDGYISAPPAHRIVGGMGALVEALRARLSTGALIAGCRVARIRRRAECIEIEVDDRSGRTLSYRTAQVLLAVPPRLAVETIDFEPALPHALALQWRHCATWMAPHAKYVAVYDRPFWKEQGLSGEVRSTVGPMVEMHDAEAPGGRAALFGFIGVPAPVRDQFSEEALLAACRAQLGRLFGAEAATPEVEFLKDWARDPYTAVAADQNAEMDHPARMSPSASDGVWQQCLIGIASEWSPQFGGYVAGAIQAARLGVEVLTAPGASRAHWH